MQGRKKQQNINNCSWPWSNHRKKPTRMHSLPESVLKLQQMGFYPDHLNSLTGFVGRMHELGQCELGMKIADTTAEGFLKAKSFDPRKTMTAAPDSDGEFVEKWNEAISVIHEKYSDRLPVQFYQVMLFTGLRPAPETEVKMPTVEHLLPDGMKWQVGDAVDHSMPLCTRLYLDIQTILCRITGRIMVHGCGCGKCAPILAEGASINVPMSSDPSVFLEETESAVRHFMTQLIPLEWGLPHSIGESMTAKMIDLRAKGRPALTVATK